MANLIRLKQIESGSQLQTSAEVGSDFSGAVYQIIDGAGLFSSSAQVDLVEASNYDGFVVQLDVTMSSDLEASIISASISQSISILSNTYVTTASLNILSSSIANTDSASQYLISQLSQSVQTTTGDFSASVAAQFSSSYSTLYSISSSTNTTINNLSSSINTSISSSDAMFAGFSSSIDTTILNKINEVGVISSSVQLTGATLKGITIAPVDSDSYSLIVSGAVAIVNATGLPNGSWLDGDVDTTVPAQLYLDGNPTTASVSPPPDPSTNNQPNSNMIDMGEF
jgi:hypothetical protein